MFNCLNVVKLFLKKILFLLQNSFYIIVCYYFQRDLKNQISSELCELFAYVYPNLDIARLTSMTFLVVHFTGQKYFLINKVARTW